jgi:hypothetical protein
MLPVAKSSNTTMVQGSTKIPPTENHEIHGETMEKTLERTMKNLQCPFVASCGAPKLDPAWRKSLSRTEV